MPLPLELGSRSHHRRGQLGQALAPGLDLPALASDRRPLRCDGAPVGAPGPIRYVPGPQFETFDAGSQAAFHAAPFTISARSDRMGIRLEGPLLQAPAGHDILSEGVVAGSVQVPGNGAPIILGRDCQTTGGYPKIATAISADLGRLAQTPFGHRVQFQEVSQADALTQARKAAKWRADLAQAMRPVAGAPNPLAHNLISGVIRGTEP